MIPTRYNFHMPHFNFRPLQKQDFALVAAWIGNEHVQKWWREPATVEHVAKEYGACTDGDFKTRVYIAEFRGRPIGMVQCYRVDDYPEDTAEWETRGYVGIDYLIGEPDMIGQGYGSAVITEFIDKVVKSVYPDSIGVIADPEVANLASIGALKRAGFTEYKVIPEGEYGTPEQLMKLRF